MRLTSWSLVTGVQTFALPISIRNAEDLGEVIIPAVYEDGLPAEKRGTTITLTGLKADAVRFSVETISNTIRDAFWGIEPSELRIKINGTEVAPEEPILDRKSTRLNSSH